MNTLGTTYRCTLLGESHGNVVGVVIDGAPAGIPFTEADVQPALDRRRPGQSDVTTPRDEKDRVEILSGTHDGVTTGATLLMLIHNQDKDSSKYLDFLTKPRPGHADLTARVAYQDHNDHRGGGLFSGRLTAGLVMAGALATKVLERQGIEIAAHTHRIGDVQAEQVPDVATIRTHVEDTPVRCADPGAAERMEALIHDHRKQQDSVGGVVQAIAEGLPAGLGDPWFHKVEAVVAHAMMALPATKGVSFGEGFQATELPGSDHNDPFTYDEAGRLTTRSNHAGGTLGGITTGRPLRTQVVFKPASSIGQAQRTVNIETGEEDTLTVEGRHDPCVVPRAVPVVEATLACALLDLIQLRRMRGHGRS
ncbi:MAG: chorismate synthase [Candidatus Thermoplasmatota archaeon]|nr:chorismate synthase [Candidatus Thermoplasmatota archaeon]